MGGVGLRGLGRGGLDRFTYFRGEGTKNLSSYAHFIYY